MSWTATVKERLVNAGWFWGVRTYRLARRVHIAASLEPAFIRLSRLVPETKGEVVATLPEGIRLVMPPGYRDTRTVVIGLFQSDETKLFRRLLEPGMTAVDVGAYAGYFTILASRLVGASGRVFALEPNRAAYTYLVRNAQLNGCSNVVPLEVAASDATGDAALSPDPSGPESFIAESHPTGDYVMVRTTTLDLILGSQGWPPVHLIKMNIEGHELRALRGMREVSRRNAQLRLIMEFNPSAMARSGATRADLQAELHELGFRRGQVVEQNVGEVRQPDLLPLGSTVYNILLTK